MIQGENSLIAVLGLYFQLRLQHGQNLLHVLGIGIQCQNLHIVLGVTLDLGLFQHIQQRVNLSLTLKVLSGNVGRVILGGEIVYLFNPGHSVFLALLHLGGIERHRIRRGDRRLRHPFGGGRGGAVTLSPLGRFTGNRRRKCGGHDAVEKQRHGAQGTKDTLHRSSPPFVFLPLLAW